MKRLILLFITIISFQVQAKQYLQVGDEYSKISYKNLYQIQENPYIDKQIENTVLINVGSGDRMNRGTGFYIGKHNNRHIFITNAHVMGANKCRSAKITFINKNFGRSSADCDSILFSMYKNEESDITVFTISGPDLENFIGEGLEIEWDESTIARTSLSQAGFGLKRVTKRDKLTDFKMNLNIDSDCVVSSADNKLYNLENFSITNTFFTGCDAAGGDSGSSLISKTTGKVVGLLWGTANYRGYINSSTYWNELIGTDDVRLYQYSSFAILLKNLRSEFAKIGVATYSQSPQTDVENN